MIRKPHNWDYIKSACADCGEAMGAGLAKGTFCAGKAAPVFPGASPPPRIRAVEDFDFIRARRDAIAADEARAREMVPAGDAALVRYLPSRIHEQDLPGTVEMLPYKWIDCDFWAEIERLNEKMIREFFGC